MPTVSEISKETKLSRVTVTKHLKHFEKSDYLDFHRQKWKLVTERVLMKMSQYVFSNYVGYKETIRAAKVYLEFADKVFHPCRAMHGWITERQTTNGTNQLFELTDRTGIDRPVP